MRRGKFEPGNKFRGDLPGEAYMEPDTPWFNRIDPPQWSIERHGFRAWRAAPRVAVVVLLLHLVFEYLRPHEIWPILGQLRIQTAVTGALVLVVIGQTAEGGVRLARQSWLLLGFLGLAVFGILVATNNFNAYDFAYDLTLNLVGYFAITHILQNERDLKRFLSLLVGIHIFVALRVMLSYAPTGSGYLTGVSAGSSFLGDENDVALAMILILPVAVYFLREASSLPVRLLWGVGSMAILLSIIFTHSRGGFVGLAAMMIYWVATSRRKVKAIGGLVVVAALLFAVAPSEYWERVETITDTDSGTAQLRRNNWAAARRMFYDSPIWGVGGKNFGMLLPDYATEYSEEWRETRWGRTAHSMYFQLLAEFGLLGVLLIGSVLLWNFRDLREVRSLSQKGECSAPIAQLADSLRLSWVGFLIPAAFLSVLMFPHLYYLTGLTIVVRNLAFAEARELDAQPIIALEGAR